MKHSRNVSYQWIKIGSFAGIISNLIFLLLIIVKLPIYLNFLFASLFGISFSLTGIAIHKLISLNKESILTKIAAIFIFVVGIMYMVMFNAQLTFNGYLEVYQSEVSKLDNIEFLNTLIKTIDSLQLSLQFSIDVLTALAMLLFASVMFKSKFFGKIWSISAVMIALALIGIKCYSFPQTPSEVGIPYVLGPSIALWFLITCIQCLNELRHANNKIKLHKIDATKKLNLNGDNSLNKSFQQIENIIQDQLIGEKLFKDSKLNVQKFTQICNITKRELTEYIRIKEYPVFKDYLNLLRVEEFKLIVRKNKITNYDLVGLAKECGFNSKSTFFRVFKDIEGITPNQFKKSIEKI
ncbi:helix-turn-helix domain-containing protein [Winogradskyella sp.]|uniref:helix-turn-helix domain-containing protein n=1 Tax=Winogradskyella sp. TaxID=1883156 RepID=UPI003BACBC16